MYNDNQKSVYKGRRLEFEIFGASHAPEIGVKIKGFDGRQYNMEELQSFLDRRRPKNTAYSTKRLETDKVVFKYGTIGGHHISGECKAIIKNNKQRSSDYEKAVKIPRPSHADYVAWAKYGDGFDHRGGGKFSGRMTAPMCIVGGLCKQFLEMKGIRINAFISRIGNVFGKNYNDINQETFDFSALDSDFPVINEKDKEPMMQEIEEARKDNDSIGGVIDCVVTGMPVGAGEYMFDSIESVISNLVFAVPAVKGIEFGRGFDFAKMRGSEANDSLYFSKNGRVKTKTNNNGGINGGLSNGMPITFRVVIKPTPSIGKEQNTVNLDTRKNTKLKIEGRHDACIVPRAVAVIEAVAAIAVYDCI